MLIEIKNLEFTYSEQINPALHHISINVEEGSLVTLCGCSGSGKSTLLRNLKPELAPTGKHSGTILFDGQLFHKIDARTLAADIGFVSQSPDNQIVADKVWHELAFGMESLGYENAVIRQRVSEMAMFFGIQNWFHKNVTELSGGQKQILCLASVLTLLPKVILLDEPTSQLDPIAASEFIGMLHKINKELGITIIITEHRLEEIIPISDQMIVLDSGNVLTSGTPEQVCESLKSLGHPMAQSMPVPVRVWSGVSNQEKSCPLDVNQGRIWLKSFLADRSIENVVAFPNVDVQHLDEKTVLKVRDLFFHYQKAEQEVLKGTSFSVRAGEIYCILGGNGTGKSTLLSVIAGLRKPQSGTIHIFEKKICMLPQNPMTLFVKNTVAEELEDVSHVAAERNEIVRLCRLEAQLNRHPYDLSGGEQQRLALAKVLLKKSDILLLDEPTKGFDQSYKQDFMKLLFQLKEQGKTVVIVSHDVEFCAQAADRCALFFDGMIISENNPHAFFSGNSFYTTVANRMSRGIVSGVITAEELIALCRNQEHSMEESNNRDINAPSDYKKIDSDVVALEVGEQEKYTGQKETDCEEEIDHREEEEIIQELDAANHGKNHIQKRYIFMTAMILLAIPLTLYAGVRFLGNQKYLFISLVVLLECMAPFVMMFEGRKPKARELVMISVLCAICIAGRGLFYMLPEFKPVVALVVIAGASLGAETGFLVGAVTMLVSNMIFGQGPWTPWQMFALGMTGFLAGILFYRKSSEVPMSIKEMWIRVAALAVYGGAAAVILYGGIMNLGSLIMAHSVMNRATIISYYVAGLPFDLIRGVATIIFTALLAKPFMEKIERTRKKYGKI